MTPIVQSVQSQSHFPSPHFHPAQQTFDSVWCQERGQMIIKSVSHSVHNLNVTIPALCFWTDEPVSCSRHKHQRVYHLDPDPDPLPPIIGMPHPHWSSYSTLKPIPPPPHHISSTFYKHFLRSQPPRSSSPSQSPHSLPSVPAFRAHFASTRQSTLQFAAPPPSHCSKDDVETRSSESGGASVVPDAENVY